MDAKTYLEQLQLIDTLIDQKQLESDVLKESVRKTKGMEYSGGRVQASAQNSQEAIICKYMDLDAEINREIDRFVDAKHQIVKQIQGLDNLKYVQILYKRYVQYKSFLQISKEMKISHQYARMLHGDALKMFEDKYKNLENFTQR